MWAVRSEWWLAGWLCCRLAAGRITLAGAFAAQFRTLKESESSHSHGCRAPTVRTRDANGGLIDTQRVPGKATGSSPCGAWRKGYGLEPLWSIQPVRNSSGTHGPRSGDPLCMHWRSPAMTISAAGMLAVP